MLVLLAVSLVTSAQPIRLAAPPFSTRGVQQKDADFFLDIFAQELKSPDLQVTTAADIESMLGMERQKALLGCSAEGSSCSVELANALGVDVIVRASLGLLEGTYVVNFQVLESRNGAPITSLSIKAKGDLKLADELQRAARELRSQMISKLRPEVAAAAAAAASVTAAAERGSKRKLALVPVAVGLVALGIGTALGVSAESRAGALASMNVDAVTFPAEDFADTAKRERAIGLTLVGIGAAAVVAGAVMFFVLGMSDVTPTAAVWGDGASFGLAGAWP